MSQHSGNEEAEFGSDISYEVQYQEDGGEDWFVFTNHHYEHATRSTLSSETHNLTEALTAARGLLSGAMVTDSRPQYRSKVTRTRIVQRVYTGTLLMVLHAE